jgi:hypothetical protein
MRRLLRRSLSAVLLLSLLACLAVAWLWWRAERAGAVETLVAVAALHGQLEVSSRPDGLFLRAIGHWPGGAGAWAGDGLDAPSCILAGPALPWQGRAIQFGVLVFQHGRLQVYLRPTGTPERRINREYLSPAWQAASARLATQPSAQPAGGWSGPLPWWQVGFIPHGAAAALFSLPPILWLAVRSRRLFVRVRRRQRGLCPRCGYDLTGNASGKCSECGAAVNTDRRVTA